MAITDETRVVEVETTEDILRALVILSGTALMQGDRRLYEHIMRAKVQYENSVNLHLTDSFAPSPRL